MSKTSLLPIAGHDGTWIPARALPPDCPEWPKPAVRIVVLPTLTWRQRLWLWQYETTTALGWRVVHALERLTDWLMTLGGRLIAWLERR